MISRFAYMKYQLSNLTLFRINLNNNTVKK